MRIILNYTPIRENKILPFTLLFDVNGSIEILNKNYPNTTCWIRKRSICWYKSSRFSVLRKP